MKPKDGAEKHEQFCFWGFLFLMFYSEAERKKNKLYFHPVKFEV